MSAPLCHAAGVLNGLGVLLCAVACLGLALPTLAALAALRRPS
jgi:hypothetical protein